MDQLLGIWIYTSLIYAGIPYPRPDTNLQMYFTFSSESENQLFYFRTNEPGFCRRTAQYSFANNKLYQKVVAVDSANAAVCDNDPDMKLNTESVSDLQVTENCLYLVLPLGDETLTYVWQRADTKGVSCDKRN